jgi:thiaminase
MVSSTRSPAESTACTAASELAAIVAQPEWDAIRTHQWMRAASAGSLTDTALVTWARQTRFLCHWELRVLGVLHSYGLPRADALLAHLESDTREGIAWLEGLLSALGQEPAGESDAWPLCVGYSAYLLSCSRDGLIEGVAVMHASELTYLRTCEWIHPTLPEGSRLRSWFSGWSDEGFRSDVAGLGACLDRLVGTPTADMRDHLTPLLRYVARFELAFWEMCWKEQSWPATGDGEQLSTTRG